MSIEVYGADIVPGMVIDVSSPHTSFSTEQRLVLATRRVTQQRLFGKFIDIEERLELLVVANDAPDPFTMRAELKAKYYLNNVVQFMLNYAGPTIPDKVWVEKV